MSHPHGSSLVNYGLLWILDSKQQNNKTKQRQRTNKQQQKFLSYADENICTFLLFQADLRFCIGSV